MRRLPVCHGSPRVCLRASVDALQGNPRDYATDNYRRVDERPFGGGPGMVMLVEPLRAAVAGLAIKQIFPRWIAIL